MSEGFGALPEDVRIVRKKTAPLTDSVTITPMIGGNLRLRVYDGGINTDIPVRWLYLNGDGTLEYEPVNDTEH